MTINYSLWDRINFKRARHLQKSKVPSQLDAPLVSFTFDDFPKTAAEHGAKLLEDHNVRGTFFAAGELRGELENGSVCFDEEDIIRLAETGHEIGCHSYSHQNLLRLSKAEIRSELVQNKAYLEGLLGYQALSSFAYPFGAVSPKVKSVAFDEYSICRSAWRGTNAGRIDMSLLRITPLEPDKLPVSALPELISQAFASNAWIIFMVHDIRSDHSNCGTTVEHYEAVVEHVIKSGIEVLPLKSAAARVVFG